MDVDGVLNSVIWYREEWNKDHVYPQGDFDPKCVEIVNRIVKETGCKVVELKLICNQSLIKLV